MIEPDDVCEPEWVDWYRMTPAERWLASEQLLDARAALTP